MLGCAALPGNVRCLPRCDERRGGMPSIVGTWKMVGATARDRDGKPLPEPYGGKGMGRVAVTAEGRMMAVTAEARRMVVLVSRARSIARPRSFFARANEKRGLKSPAR